MFKFDNSYSRLPPAFWSPVKVPNTFQASLLAWNESLGNELGLDVSYLHEKTLAGYFSATEFMSGTTPIAMAYAGHQFGHFVPQLGDGRAMLLGEIVTDQNERFDVHLKGSGRTVFSRRGDGLSALGPVVREFIVSEGMHHLGIATTRSLCAVRTGQVVQRESLLPGGVLTRVAKSHIRVGTFQFFAYRGDFENLKVLLDYTMKRLYPEVLTMERPILEFWRAVAKNQVELISKWMSVGFIHGVMNTDNMAISGETIDYGPCAFMDEFKMDNVFSSIDQQGRYAYSNQPKIAIWNLARLAECLLPLMGDVEQSQKIFESELNSFHQLLMQKFAQTMIRKLGADAYLDGDEDLVHSWFEFMELQGLDFTLSFIDLERHLEGKNTFTQLEEKPGFENFIAGLRMRFDKEDRSLQTAIEGMRQLNPFTIPRNHQIEATIKAAEMGDDAPFFSLLEAVRKPYERSDELGTYQTPPQASERVTRTFCGT